MYRIGREALVNAFRHASARRVEIQLEYSSDCLRVSVRDDGCGIEPGIVQDGRPGRWGILEMRERADRIRDTQAPERAGSGTEVEVLVPGDVAFRQASIRRKARWFRRRLDTRTRVS